jgi:hypothetical protein
MVKAANRFARNHIDCFARSVVPIGQVEQGANLFNRESWIACAPCERQAATMFKLVGILA